MGNLDAWMLVVVGQRGQGKTTLIQGESGITEGLLAYLEPPVFVLDTIGNFDRGMVFKSPKQFQRFRASELKGQRENRTGVYILRALSDKARDAYLRMIYQPAALYYRENGSGSELLAGTLILDEAPKFCSAHKVHPTLHKLVQYGRNYGINLVMASRRYRQLNVNIRSQADAVISFAQWEQQDVRELGKIDSKAKKLTELGDHEWMTLGSAGSIPPVMGLMKEHGLLESV